MSGWIKIHRKITEWQWYSDANTRMLFLHLLFTANFEEKHWLRETIQPGQLATSVDSLAFQTTLSPQQVRSAINKLKSTNEITIKTTNKYSIITICNWNYYQENNTEDNKQVTNKQQTSNKQITTTKEYKKERIEESNPPTPLVEWMPVEQWNAYKEMRRKINKPMTEYAETLAIKKLDKFRVEGKDIIKILEYSILNNYQGIFEPKGGSNGKSSWKSEGDRLRAKIDREIEALEKEESVGNAGAYLQLTAPIRKD